MNLRVWVHWRFWTIVKKRKKKISYKAFYKGQKMSGIYPAQTLKENVACWIKTSPLDAKNTALPELINDALRIPKR